MIEIGIKSETGLTVESRHTAIEVGSGELNVLATPSLLALMENAAMNAVKPFLAPGETTVGGHISVSHLKPSPVGARITALAEVVGVDGRKVSFRITAHDGDALIGEGEHTRFIVDAARFMNKLKG